MKPKTTLRALLQALRRSLAIAAMGLALLLAPIALGLHLLGVVALPAGLCYGLALPLTLVFGVCLIKFPWDTKIIMSICVGLLFLMSFYTVKGVQLKQLQRNLEKQQRAETAPAKALP